MAGRILALLLVALVGCGARRMPHEGKSVAQLQRMLDDPTPRVQAQGALGLSLLGPEAFPAKTRLSELLASENVLGKTSAMKTHWV